MFILVSIRRENVKDYRVLSYGYKTVLDAGRAREVSGDLVVDGSTGKIVSNKLWLFPWERNNPECFARRMITKGNKARG